MVRSQTSLRRLVEKWLAPTLAKPVRITRFSRIANQRRYICVEAVRPTDMLVIFSSGTTTARGAFFHPSHIGRP